VSFVFVLLYWFGSWRDLFQWPCGPSPQNSHLLFSLRHRTYLIRSAFVGELIICWKNVLLFDQHTADEISHKSLHKYHSLHVSGFDSAGMFYFMAGYVKQLESWICCVSHCNYKVHNACCKSLTNLQFVLSYWKQGAKTSSLDFVQLWRVFCKQPLPSYLSFAFLWKK